MKTDKLNIIIPIVAFLICWKILFAIFQPSEIWTMLVIPLILFLAYGIQSVEWAKTERTAVFGINVHEKVEVFQQYRIFGVIPVCKARTLLKDSAVLSQIDLPNTVQKLSKSLELLIPFLGYKGIMYHKG